MNDMTALTHYQRLAREAAAYQAAEAKRKAAKALQARLAKLYPIPVCIDGVDVVCYVDADDNCEAVMLGDVEISPLLELASAAGDRWWRVLDDLIDTAVSEQNAHDAAANAADRAESIAYARSAA
jgi:hypothetical protein